jgi:hypothetical protein
MKKQDVLNRVLNSESSIFSKDDVVRLIESLDETTNITVTDIGAAIDKVMDEFGRRNSNLLDKSTAEFCLNGNEVELEDVDVDLDYIRETLEEHLMPLGEVDQNN